MLQEVTNWSCVLCDKRIPEIAHMEQIKKENSESITKEQQGMGGGGAESLQFDRVRYSGHLPYGSFELHLSIVH